MQAEYESQSSKIHSLQLNKNFRLPSLSIRDLFSPRSHEMYLSRNTALCMAIEIAKKLNETP